MGKHESIGKSDEWYTPKYIFDALCCEFDLDVAAPLQKTNVPAKEFITENSLQYVWSGFIWCNPPFGRRNGIQAWAYKFVDHGNGIILTPDRTSAPWWQYLANNCEYVLFVNGKIKFIRPHGSKGEQPANGTTLFSIGPKGFKALLDAEKNKLGILYNKNIYNQYTNL